MSSRVGIVVVGVGIAGRVRIKDILKEATSDKPHLNNVTLVGYVSRREVEIEGVKQLSLEEALSCQDVHAVLICTENETHATLARQVIEAGKHVLVEFPLALTADTAKELIQLAQDKGVICYEEDISLITDAHKTAKQLVQEKGLKTVHKTLKGRLNGWIEDTQRSGSPFVSAITILHLVIELCGDVKPVAATLTTDGTLSYKATASLTGKNNTAVTLEYERNAGIERRQTSLSYTLGDDTVVTEKTLAAPGPPDPTRPGLFLRDLMTFVSMIRGEMTVTASNSLTIHALEIADELYKLAKSGK